MPELINPAPLVYDRKATPSRPVSFVLALPMGGATVCPLCTSLRQMAPPRMQQPGNTELYLHQGMEHVWR
jgi:hypothetical protein